MRCIWCKGKDFTKNGFAKGKQRYLCKNPNCKRNFTASTKRKPKGYSEEVRAQAIYLYQQGCYTLREVADGVSEQFLLSRGVSHVAVYNWVHQPKPSGAEDIATASKGFLALEQLILKQKEGKHLTQEEKELIALLE